ncbi:hypothetical protein [Methylomarinovum tepidoasis]|nr:hypothetical protein [Methylomarinovum sp. IN45]
MKENERLISLLGLAATRREETEDHHPPPEVLAAFIEQRLPSSRRQAVLAHLNRCECCYQEWLHSAAALEEAQPEETPIHRPAWWQRLWERLRPRPWLIPLTVAVTAGLAVAVVLVQQPMAGEWPPRQIIAALPKGHKIPYDRLPRLEAPFAFNDTAVDPAKDAVSQGLRDARFWIEHPNQVDLRDETHDTPEKRAYRSLGQWLLLAWAMTQKEDSDPNVWQVFQQYGQSLAAEFGKLPPSSQRDQALADLREVQTMMEALAEAPGSAQRTRLQRKLRLIIGRWQG